ncbi:hypothetical protein ABZ725_07885 [Streptomyces sp. NPDC006872]|uniref:hypothetical protein n=1 Tax=Streptomyces sp. NPDC006872 TaxID=3155720 RepID=UPI0034011C83
MGLLSWLTRSGERSRGATEPGTRAGADAGTTSPGPDAATDAQVTGGWRSAPPVQRTLSAPMGLLTDPRGFGQRLGTWQDPTVTGPLGHLVSAQAPSGVGHGLAELSVPVQRTSIWPQAQAQAHASDGWRGAQDPDLAQVWAGETDVASAPVASGTGDRPGAPHGTAGPAGPVVSRSVSPTGGTAHHPDHAPTPTPTPTLDPDWGAGRDSSAPDGVRVAEPAPLPQTPLQRTTVPLTRPAARDTAPLAPLTVMRMRSLPAAPAGPAPTRPLNVAESPDAPAWELAAVAPPPVPDTDAGPLAPAAPDEPVADLLATPDTHAGQGEQSAVVQRTEASLTAPPTVSRDTGSLPLAAPRTGPAADQAPQAAPTAPLIGGMEGVGPAVQPVVQRDVAAAPARPRHRGLGEPLAALPPTALPLPGPAAPPTGSAVFPSVPSDVYVSRTAEVPQTPAAPDDPGVPHAPEPPTVLDLVAGPAEPGVSSSEGEGTAPLLGDTPPLTTDPVDLGTGLSQETATGPGTETVQLGPVPALGTGPGPSSGPGAGFGSGSGTGPSSGFGSGSSSGFGAGPGPGFGPGPDAVSGPAAGSGGAAAPGPVAVQRLEVSGGSPHATPSTDATPLPAEGDRAPLLGDAEPLTVSDTVVPEAPGPGEMVTSSSPMPVRRLDAVDEATLPEAGFGAGAPARGAGPVFPLVAQRSLPLFTVPESARSAQPPVASEPPAAVPVRWERVGGGASGSRASGSGGRAWSADVGADGFGEPGDPGDYGGPPGGRTASGGGSAYPGVASGDIGDIGDIGGFVQRSAVGTGVAALADSAPPARSYGVPDRPGFPGPPEFPGGPGVGAVLPDGIGQPYTQPYTQPSTRAFHDPGGLGPAVPLQRLATERGGVDPSPVHPSAPTAPLSPAPRGQAPSVSTPPGDSAGAAAVAAGVARWASDGSVEFIAPAVQRAEDGLPVTEPPADPPAQPEPVDPPASTVGADGDSTSAAAPGKSGAAGAPKVTDELVRALLAPLSRLLRAELRIERERAGSLLNTRH